MWNDSIGNFIWAAGGCVERGLGESNSATTASCGAGIFRQQLDKEWLEEFKQLKASPENTVKGAQGFIHMGLNLDYQ